MTAEAQAVEFTEAQAARAVAIADAIQRAVAARPDLAVSMYGIGLDALSTKLRNDATFLPELEPWLRLAVGVYDYVLAGTDSPEVSALLGGAIGGEGS